MVRWSRAPVRSAPDRSCPLRSAPGEVVIGQHRTAPVPLVREIALMQLQDLTQFLRAELPHRIVTVNGRISVHRTIRDIIPYQTPK